MLVTFGERDDVWPPDVQAQMGKRLGAEVAVIADGAHSPAAQQPEQTVETLLEFWRSLP
jgi:pimeloyl-ACP methyl ester carboxylesterase